jgi:DNA-binding transcriptional ArsR family regulator
MMGDLTLSDPMIEEVSLLFLALSDASRLKILRCLLESRTPMAQGTVAEATGLSQANASKHLALLVRVGLATREPQGNIVYFAPVLPLVANVCDLVCGHVTERAKAAYHALH